MSAKSTILLASITALLAQPCLGEDQKVEKIKSYERKVTENWAVQGFSFPKHDRNDVCVAFKEWKDGSKIELVKDLKTGELRIWHQVMGWNRINDEKMKTYSLRMNLHDQQNNVVDGGTIEYRLINKNTIVIPQIDEKRFLKAFVNSNRINLIPDGNISNTQVFMDGRANEIAIVLADCIQASGKGGAPATTSSKDVIEPPSLDLPPKSAAGYKL